MRCEQTVRKIIDRVVYRIFYKKESKPVKVDDNNISSSRLKILREAKSLTFTGDQSPLERQVVEHSVYHNQ